MQTQTTNTAARSTAGAVDMSFWLFFVLTWLPSDPTGALQVQKTTQRCLNFKVA
jgi:hypothetical protein